MDHDVVWDAELSAAAAIVVASILEWPGLSFEDGVARTLGFIAAHYKLKNAEDPSKAAAENVRKYEAAAAKVANGDAPRIRHYAAPALLVIDEVGYLSYSNRHADLLFELISRRYQQKSTVVTTNRPFAEWHEVFPNAACVVSMVDRLMHNAEVVSIKGESYRAKEARERAEQKVMQRRAAKSAPQAGGQS